MQANLRCLLYKAGIIIFALFGSCHLTAQYSNPYATIAAIPVPPGYHRIPAESASFATWLYLTTVFTYCSTRTLEKQLLPVTNYRTISAGEVLIKGGSPGHAMLVADIAEDAKGRRIYLLAQSYMPAQDIHIVNNPRDAAISPWYESNVPDTYIQTPEWTFRVNELRCWPTLAGKQ